MALARIRANNNEFRNAQLVGAQIRVRGGVLHNPFHLDEMNMRRVSSLLQQDDNQLTGEHRDSILRDIMVSDIIGRARGRGAELNGPI